MRDPYLYSDVLVLRNKLDIRTEKTLDLIEAEQSRTNRMLLYELGFSDFSPKGLCEIHRFLFGDPYGGAEMLVASVEDEDGKSVMLIGTDADNPYLYFKDETGRDIDITDGCYITSLTALICGWQKGDAVTLYNPLTLEERTITIAGVLKNDISSAIYMSKERAAEFAGLADNVYNAIMSDKKLDIPSSKVAAETSRASLDAQLQTVNDQMAWMLYLMIGLGVIVCVASVYVAVNMMVTENRSNISMLKVLGYQDRKISRIVLSVNHIFLPLGILLSIPAALAAMDPFLPCLRICCPCC